MKSHKRALRRHHRQRMIRRAFRLQVLLWGPEHVPELQFVLRWFNNRKKCSCYLCGNPRRYEGKVTRQERLFNELQLEEDAVCFPEYGLDGRG